MASRRREFVIGAMVMGGLVVVAWIAGEVLIHRTNPPKRHVGVILSTETDPLLKRACFDCHSNEVRYPWYSYLPLASLQMALHVRMARSEFNFSEWDMLEPDDKVDTLEEGVKAIRTGRMPPWDYRIFHAEARLTPAELQTIERAVAAVRNAKNSGAADSHSTGGRR